MELMNQAFVLMMTYHFYSFTNFMTEPMNRYYMGISLVAAVCLMILVNLGILTAKTVSVAVRKLKRQYMAY